MEKLRLHVILSHLGTNCEIGLHLFPYLSSKLHHLDDLKNMQINGR